MRTHEDSPFTISVLAMWDRDLLWSIIKAWRPNVDFTATPGLFVISSQDDGVRTASHSWEALAYAKWIDYNEVPDNLIATISDDWFMERQGEC